MARRFLILATGLLFGAGCADEGFSLKTAARSAAPASEPGGAADKSLAKPVAADPARAESGAVPPPSVPRKIIYNADLSLIVENFSEAEQSLKRLVQTHQGYLANMDIAGSPGAHRYGTWRVRVPIERFDSFLADVGKLGELEREQTNSQDVTEEFYDLEARIKNKKVEESRLQKHLEESTGKLSEILEVERELSRVREEIERMEGRKRLLENLTSLTTVTLTIHERVKYTPERAPTFATRIARTFQTSLDSVVSFGEAIVLFFVAIAPWLPMLVVVALAVLLFVRWLFRLYRRQTSLPTAHLS
jgi:hypothetical protein